MLEVLRSALHRARGARLPEPLRRRGGPTVADRLERLAAQRPEATFLRFGGRTLTYGQWNQAANRVAHWAVSEGLGPGDVVALLMESRPEQTVLWAGLAKVGASVAVVAPELRGRALRRVMEISGAETLVVGPECLSAFRSIDVDPEPQRPEPQRGRPSNALLMGEPGGGALVASEGLDDLDAMLEAMPGEDLPRSARRGVHPDDALFAVFPLDGSEISGELRLSHRSFLALGKALAELAELQSSDALTSPLAMHHGLGGLAAVAAALQSGASLLGCRSFEPERFWQATCEEGATALVYQGEVCRALLAGPEAPREREHGLRVAFGSGLSPALWRRFRERFAIPEIREFYADAEGSRLVVNATGRVGAVGRLPPPSGGAPRLVRYDAARRGHPRGSDGRCIECRPGEVGELVGPLDPRRRAARSPDGGAEGAASLEARGRRLLRDVRSAGDLYVCSGDLFQLDTGGWLSFVGPVAEVFSCGGVCIFPRAAEQVLASFPGVRIASVYAVPLAGDEEPACMAALSLDTGSGIDGFDAKGFYGHAVGGLPAAAVPRFLRLVRELPPGASARPAKGALRGEGCDPLSCPDPLLVRDDRAGAYVPLGSEAFE